ncbi:hypothetical protein TSOC_005855 [Tetrabaena socialis]|uniref:Uncharacterized protein n=1 Tax=Tetrabaena socialis TaxID=47790 RepID=A0A2J8A5C8_9CHLO|nr:hypothetical protein TSOC_005855 [Tetrabaena socialis]|eukprot:PNH07707.1 hypothetical protein TSOC_005855 [Tetrabaena socialis]
MVVFALKLGVPCLANAATWIQDPAAAALCTPDLVPALLTNSSKDKLGPMMFLQLSHPESEN